MATAWKWQPAPPEGWVAVGDGTIPMGTIGSAMAFETAKIAEGSTVVHAVGGLLQQAVAAGVNDILGLDGGVVYTLGTPTEQGGIAVVPFQVWARPRHDEGWFEARLTPAVVGKAALHLRRRPLGQDPHEAWAWAQASPVDFDPSKDVAAQAAAALTTPGTQRAEARVVTGPDAQGAYDLMMRVVPETAAE